MRVKFRVFDISDTGVISWRGGGSEDVKSEVVTNGEEAGSISFDAELKDDLLVFLSNYIEQVAYALEDAENSASEQGEAMVVFSLEEDQKKMLIEMLEDPEISKDHGIDDFPVDSLIQVLFKSEGAVGIIIE